MTRKLTIVLGLLLLASMIVGACAPAATPTAAPTKAPAAAATTAPATAPTKAPAATTAATTPQAAASGPLKIGIVSSFTGAYAGVSENWMTGFKLRLSQINNKLGGRDVQLITDDDGMDVNTGMAKIKKQVEQDKVDILLAAMLQALNSAADDYISKQTIPSMTLSGATIKAPNRFSPASTAESFGEAAGNYAYNKLGYRKMVNMYTDSGNGPRYIYGFTQAFKKAGGTIVGDVKIPLGAPDYGPYMSNIPQGIDAIDAYFAAQDGIRFIQARYQAGLRDKTPVFGAQITDDYLLSQQGEAALGAMVIGEFYTPLDYAGAKAYKQAYIDMKVGKTAGDIGLLGAHAYTVAQVLEETLKKTNGATQPANVFMNAMRSINFESPMGTFRFDDKLGYPIKPLNVMKVVQGADGKPALQLVESIKDVKPWLSDL